MNPSLLRPAGIEDFPSVARIFTEVWPEMPVGVDLLEHDERSMEADLRPRFWIAEERGQPVGVAEAYRDPGAYHPQKWTVKVAVLPAHRGAGVGTALYQEVRGFLDPRDPISIETRVRDVDPSSLAYAQRRGYAEVKRDFFSDLALTGREFPVPPVPPGLAFLTLKEADSPDFRSKLHRAFEEVRIDIPRASPPTEVTQAFFEAQFLGDPGFRPEGSFVVLDGGEIAGFTICFHAAEEGLIEQGLTAVRRPWRRRGLARALKLAVLRYGQSAGYQVVRTDNDSRNTGILALNESLGFVRGAGWIHLRLDIR